MAKIEISQFEGIKPSVDARNLPPGSAQRAHNLDLRFDDFRPVRDPGASVATVEVGARSIFRTPSGVWLSSANDVDYVNGQVNDAASERVYLTGRVDYPEAWQGGAYRRLGVPSPGSPPTTTVNTVSQFSIEDRLTAANVIVAEIFADIVAARTGVSLGGGLPTDGGSLGGVWLAHGAISTLPSTGPTQINFLVPYTGTTTTSAANAYLLDPTLNGKAVTYSAAAYWAVPMPWRAAGYSVNTTTLTASLKLIKTPPANVLQLIPDATAAEMSARIAALYSAAEDPTLTRVGYLNAAQADVLVQVLRTDSNAGRANALAARLATVSSVIQAIEDYQLALVTNSTDIVGTLLREYEYLLPAGIALIEETRGYIYTRVTDWGEESAPSPASDLVTLDQNDSVTVEVPLPVSSNPYGPFTAWRLYRSSTTNTGAAYQLVTEVAFIRDVDGNYTGGGTYTDALKQEELQETCQTLTWVEPPRYLKGLVGLPNGIMAGFFGKTLCFSEPFAPYAWPVEYQQTVEHDIIGLGVFGQTLVVLTKGNPYFCSGADSASMSLQKLESTQACLSKRSIASAEGGVIYASPDGVCIAGPGGVVVVTQAAYDRDTFQALGIEGSFGVFSEGVYYLVTER